MNMLSFDTHAAVKELRELGMVESQAEGIVNIVTRGNDQRLGELATKAELKELRSEIGNLKTELRSEIAQLGTELRSEIAQLGTELRSAIAEQGATLRGEMATYQTEIVKGQQIGTRWMMGTMFGLAGVVLAVVKLL